MISAARQFDNERGDDWAVAQELIGGPSWAYSDEMLRFAARHGVNECRNCGTLWLDADMTPQLTCGRCC